MADSQRKQTMSDNNEDNKPTVVLIGQNGNAFSIIAACNRAARKAGWTKESADDLTNEMMSGDYDGLLLVAAKHFNIV